MDALINPLLSSLTYDKGEKGEVRTKVIEIAKMDGKYVIDLLQTVLSRRDSVNEQEIAVKALIEIGNPVVVLQLVNLAQLDEKGVWHTMIHGVDYLAVAMESIGERAVGFLIERLGMHLRDSNRIDENYINRIVWVFVQIGSPAIQHLYEELHTNNHNWRRVAAAEVLARMRSVDAVDELATLLHDNFLQKIAREGLINIGGLPAKQIFRNELQTDNINFRISAATALAQLTDSNNLDDMVALLSNSDFKIRNIGIERLCEIGGSLAMQHLSVALSEKDNATRYAASLALDRLGWQPDENMANTRAGVYFTWIKTIRPLAWKCQNYYLTTKEMTEKLENICNAQSISVLLGVTRDKDFDLPVAQVMINLIQKILEKEPSEIDNEDLIALGNLNNLEKQDYWKEEVEVDKLDLSADEYRSAGREIETHYHKGIGHIDASKIRDLADGEINRRGANSK